MSDQRIPISQLSETQTAPNASYIAIDDGSLTKKITVENFNSTSTSSAQQYANQAAASAQTVEDNIATSAAQIREATLAAREATQASTSATASATSAYDSASLAQNYSVNAATSAGQAMNAADTVAQGVTDSKEYAEDSEAWAVGQRNGVDVPASDETYQNNAKYYANSASGSATRAEAAAQSITVPDTTLTVSGVAADSKATGDRISAADAELVDIRVMSSGFSASTAGDAVRAQYSELKNDISEITEPTRNINTAEMGRYRSRSATGAIETGGVNYYGMRNYVPCAPDTNYVISVYDITYTGTLHIYEAWYAADGTYIETVDKTTSVANKFVKVTSPSTAGFIYSYCYQSSGITISENSKMQIEAGTEKTEYTYPAVPVGTASITSDLSTLKDNAAYKVVMSRDTIPANSDLDEYKTPGIYSVVNENGSTINNYPASVSSEIVVFNSRGSGNNYSYGTIQVVFENKYPFNIYWRSYRASTWRQWNRSIHPDEVKNERYILPLPKNPYKAVALKTENSVITWSDKVKDIKSTTHVHVANDANFNKLVTKGYEHVAISNYHASIPAVPIAEFLPTATVPSYWRESPNAEHVYFTGESTSLHMNAIGSFLMSGTDNTGAGSGGYDGTVDDFLKKAIDFLQFANGGGVSINHPKWSGLTSDKIIELYDKGGIFALEIYNAGCEYHQQNGYALELWDAVLATGRQIFGLAVPDHSAQASAVPAPDWETLPFGYNHLLCKTNDESEILQAYRNGRFYTTIDNDTLALTYFGLENGTATIRTSEAGTITFTTATRTESFANASEASLAVTSEDVYVRASCTTSNNKLFTNAIMI